MEGNDMGGREYKRSVIAVVIDDDNEQNIVTGKINSPAYLLSNK